VSSVPTVSPSLVQVILGGGFPIAEQRNVTTTPSMRVWSAGLAVKRGATAKRKIEKNFKEGKASS